MKNNERRARQEQRRAARKARQEKGPAQPTLDFRFFEPGIGAKNPFPEARTPLEGLVQMWGQGGSPEVKLHQDRDGRLFGAKALLFRSRNLFVLLVDQHQSHQHFSPGFLAEVRAIMSKECGK